MSRSTQVEEIRSLLAGALDGAGVPRSGRRSQCVRVAGNIVKVHLPCDGRRCHCAAVLSVAIAAAVAVSMVTAHLVVGGVL